jgi:hypothetical protein
MVGAKGWADSVSIIPILPGSKKPAIKWEEFQKRRATTDEREAWKREFPGCNWAIVTGEVSGLFALDWDKAKGRELRKEKNVYGGPASITPSGGFHTLHAHPGRRVPNGVRLLGDESGGLDIRGDGGYIVCPPSIVDGKAYKWEIPPWMGELSPAPEWVWPLIERGNGAGATPAGTSSPQLNGLPPGVSKGQRNQTMAQYAGRYLRKGCTAEETFQILRAVNQKFQPPLPEEEVRRIVFSIARREREKTPTIELIDSSELATLAPRTEKKIIDPFLPAASKAILAGWQGSYKSTLALNWAVAIRNGHPVFGRFDAIQGRVLYVDRENAPGLTNLRVEKIAQGIHGLRGGIKFQFPKEKPDLGQPRIREAYIRIIEQEKIDLAIFDSFLCFFNLRNENDNTEIRNVLELVGEIPAKTGAAVMFIDHAAKASPERSRAKIAVTPRGASAKGDWADLVMTLEEREHESRKLRVLRFPKTRFNLPMPPMILEVGTNLVFVPSGEDETCPVFTVRQAVEDNPGIAATKLYRMLMSLTGCSRPTADKAARRAAELGFISRVEQSKYVNYFPVRLGKNEDFPNLEETENEHEKDL